MAFKGQFVILLAVLVYSVYANCDHEPANTEWIKMKLLELENDILKLKKEACDRDQEIKDLKHLTTKMPTVAFRSILTAGTDNGKDGQIVVFDQAGLNIGSAYNTFTGIFTAPYNGTYSFSMYLGNPGGKPGAFFLVKSDGSTKEKIEFAFGGHTPGWDMGGLTTYAELNVGNTIWVEREGYVSGSFGTNRYHTGFAGALVNIS